MKIARIHDMKIYEVEERTSQLLEILLDIWEDSVRATHLFLSDTEVNQIKQYVPKALSGVEHLMVAKNESDKIIGFMGLENDRLEMLFLCPTERGKGVGKQLIQYGIRHYGIREVTVNEQNPQAVGFYEHLGFETYKRTDCDEEGNPYPLLYMKQKNRTNKEIFDIAMRQSAYDLNAKVSDFLLDTNVVVKSGIGALAKKYYEEPIACNFVSYGSNIVASVKEEYYDIVEKYLRKFEFYHCFETPNLHWLDERMKEHGYRVCFMAEYFLPDVNVLKRRECNYHLRVLEQKDFENLYLPAWGNALCKERKQLDVLGIGAYDGEKLIGLAACSADCEDMWQIGVDVLPDYRRQGIASSLTSNLAVEIMDRGKVPFYCCAWSNLKSLKNALRSGFVPGWVEMTVKTASVVEDMNK